MSDYGPLDDFDDDDDAPQLRQLAGRERRYEREHEFVSPACAHRRHRDCELTCPLCADSCRCACHTWKAVQSA